MRYSLLLVILVCFSCQPKHDLPKVIALHDNWRFKKVTDSVWQSATVPGNVHSDLLDHQRIEDPFIGNNEKDVQWVSDTDWEYKTTFSLDKETLQKQNFQLSFEGLDTYASVYLNDSLILKANNAFRAWHVNVKSLLSKQNELRLVFEHTSKYEEAKKKSYLMSYLKGIGFLLEKPNFNTDGIGDQN
jgi:beta-mannosidase